MSICPLQLELTNCVARDKGNCGQSQTSQGLALIFLPLQLCDAQLGLLLVRGLLLSFAIFLHLACLFAQSLVAVLGALKSDVCYVTGGIFLDSPELFFRLYQMQEGILRVPHLELDLSHVLHCDCYPELPVVLQELVIFSQHCRSNPDKKKQLLDEIQRSDIVVNVDF